MPEEAKKLVLVVDDEPRMIQFIRMNLELEGYRVTQAANGLEALDKVRDQLPDLVILDVMMPELDGFETLRMLREVTSVPVIMLTVKADEDDKVKGLSLGAPARARQPRSSRSPPDRDPRAG
jgi:two-component system KDP operon response regulator KdpE